MEYGQGRTPSEFFEALYMEEYFEILEMMKIRKEELDKKTPKGKSSRLGGA